MLFLIKLCTWKIIYFAEIGHKDKFLYIKKASDDGRWQYNDGPGSFTDASIFPAPKLVCGNLNQSDGK
jgi:hypothetical protein